MEIRKATVKDAHQIQFLLDQLGYPTEDGYLASKIAQLSDRTDHQDLVCVLDGKVVGFMSLHYIPQIAFESDYVVISYLVVDADVRSKGVGKALDEYCTSVARERKCKRILVHSNARRTEAHRFYLRQGYIEYPKDFVKFL